MSNEVRTLIVEDDASLREVIAQFLSIYHTVSTAKTLEEAREFLSRNSYDLVLLDKRLPDGNGLDLLDEIVQSRPETAVIILTSDEDLNSVTKALNRGADDYLVKTEHLVPHLLIRFPVAMKHAQNRCRLQEAKKQLQIRLPQSREEFCPQSFQTFLEQTERSYLTAALNAFDGNVLATAEQLEISRSTLFRKLSEFGISRKRNIDELPSQLFGDIL